MAAKPLGEETGPAASRGTTPARVAVIVALAAAVIILAIVFFSGGSGHKYTLVFQNAGQLVPDNQVLIGGSPAGTVESIGLTDDNLAEVNVEVDQELHEGTTATIRATSLSGVANHYVSISPGPNSNDALDDGAELGLASTTTPVDIDQFFNTFPPRVRKGLEDFIKGNAAWYSGQGKNGNEAYKYFGSALNRTAAFARELNADQRLLSRFVVSSARLTTAVAGRGEQLFERDLQRQHRLRVNREPDSGVRRVARRLPPVFRQSNTTFVNLRAALDDLEPLVNTAKPATKDLAPFLAELRPVFQKLVPFTRNLRLTVSQPGKGNDLGDLLAVLPKVAGPDLERIPALRTGDLRLPAEPELHPRLHAGPVQRAREVRPGRRLLRRQRPLRARGDLRPKPLQLQPGKLRTRADQQRRTVRRVRLGRDEAPLPRRRHSTGPRRLQPLGGRRQRRLL